MQDPSGSPQAPERSRRSRGPWILLAIVVALGILLVLVAPPLLEGAAIRALEEQGLAPARLRVALGPGGIEVTDIALGDEPAVEIRRLRIALSPLGLLRGEVDAIELVAASVRGRLEAGTLRLGDLVLGGEGSDEADGGGLVLPLPKQVLVEALQVFLDSPLGRFEGDASLQLALPGGSAARGQGSGALRLEGAPLATFELEAEDTRITVGAALDFEASSLRELGFPELERVKLAARLSGATEGGSWANRLTEGELDVKADVAARRPASGKPDASGAEAPAFALQAHLELAARAGRGHLELAVRGPGPGEQPLRVADLTASSFGLTGDFALEAEGDALALRVDPCLAWQLRDAAWGGERTSPGTSKGCLRSSEHPLIRASQADAGWDVRLDLVADQTELSLESQGEPWIEGEAPSVQLGVDALAGAEPRVVLHLEGGRLRVANGAAALGELEADWTSGEKASLRIDRLTVGEPPTVRPLVFRLESSAVPPFEFRAELRDRGGELRLTAAGRHDPDKSEGTARIDLLPLRFRSGTDAFQPEQLLPSLGDGIGQVDATFDGSAELGWKGEKTTSRGQLRLADGTLVAEAWGIEGLAGSLDLVNVWPLESAPGQRLAFRRLRAGLPLEDGEIQLRVGPGWEQLELESASGRVARGMLRVKGQLDFQAGVQQLDFRVEELSLAELVELAAVDRLEVTGTLAGEVPLVLRGGEPTVLAGRLAADPPTGTIRYRPEAPPPALAGLGAQGELVMKALEDFHYDSLQVDLGMEAGGQARVLLQLKGRNPAIEGGRPIHLSLDLSGPLLAVLQSDPLMRDVVEKFSRRALKGGTAPRPRPSGE